MTNNHDIIYPKTFLPHPFKMCMTFLTMLKHGISIYRGCVGDLIVSGHPIEHFPRIFLFLHLASYNQGYFPRKHIRLHSTLNGLFMSTLALFKYLTLAHALTRGRVQLHTLLQLVLRIVFTHTKQSSSRDHVMQRHFAEPSSKCPSCSHNLA
jgi:hypothetical protein